jgi:regulator of protease activity HflC (stomatin/prohibitin superfamily)
VSPIGALLGACLLVSGIVAVRLTGFPWLIVPTVLLSMYCMLAVKVASQWEKVAVLRLGRFIGLRGPGVFHVIPVIDSLSKFVDQRIRVTDVSAESALTSDTVPVNVDAIVFWVAGMRKRAFSKYRTLSLLLP